MASAFHRLQAKLCYLCFIVLLNISFAITAMLHLIVPLLIRCRKKKDLILFPYAFKGSDGYIRRFEEYIPYLEREGRTFRICTTYSDEYARKMLAAGERKRYLFYLRLYWKRIPQVLAAAGYRAVFIQRGLFPVYFDLQYPHLEALLRKLNPHITIDYWDAVFDRQEGLVTRTIRFADQLSLSNEYIASWFSRFTGRRVLWKIAVNTERYRLKEDYTLHDPARLVWTGLPHNLKNLASFLPVLAGIAESRPLILVIISQQAVSCEGLTIEHHPWQADTFFQLLQSADIGLYPENNTVVAKGKSTMKVMDYLATGLPMIGVPFGLPPEVSGGRELLIAEEPATWRVQLLKLLDDRELREQLGRNGRKMIEENYSLDASYEVFRTFAFNNDTPACAE
ncbi:MAG TPA: glycosyltransferase [Bacteroidales bacterium]|nr:glycosyltransferase [Bacteroidales bacterium]HSA43485.1 glycosyltransferase [Bacteroidales bacterium]